MAQQGVNEIFDIGALNSQKEQLNKMIGEIKANLEDLSKIGKSIQLSSSVSGSENGVAAANAAMVEFTKNLKDYNEAIKATTRSKKALTDVSDEDAAKQKVNATNLNRQLKEEVTLTSNLTSPYEKLNAQHKLAIKAYQDAAAAGKVSAQQLVVLKDRANELGQQLVKIDSAVGNYRRNVGNYSSAWNGLGMSIQQVARELPNFAQSMQLGFLAISNNLPILADEIKRAKDNIAGLKAEGKDAPSLFKQIAASVFSWQTAMTIGITLLVKYGSAIVDWAMSVTTAESVQRSYSKALEESIKAESDGISKLLLAKEALNSSNVSREEQLKLLKNAKAESKGYLDNLDIETSSLYEINKAIDLQVWLRIQNAKAMAAEETASEYTKTLVSAQQELTKEVGFFEKAWAQLSAGFIVDSKSMTDETKKLNDEEYKRYKAGLISYAQYAATAKRIQDVSDAQKGLSEATKLSLNPLYAEIKAAEKQISVYRERIISIQESIARYGDIDGSHKKELASINKETNAIIDNIVQLKIQQKEKQRLLGIGEKVEGVNIALEKARAEAGAKTAGTLERLNKDRQVANLETKDELDKMRKEYKVASDKDLEQNVQYQQRRAIIIQKGLNKIKDLEDSFNKQKEKENRTKKDPNADNLEKFQKDIFDKADKKSKEAMKRIFNNLNDIELKQVELQQSKVNDLIEQLERGEIGVKEFEANKSQIMKKSQHEILELQLEYVRKYLETEGLLAPEIKIIEEKITDLTKSELKIRSLAREDEAKKSAQNLEDFQAAMYAKKDADDKIQEQKEKERNDRIIQQAKELYGYLVNLYYAQSEAKISQINKEKDAVSERYELEKTAIDNAFLSDEEKAARKKVLDAEEAQSQKELDKKIREIKRKQAIFDKAQALATIAINTAVAATQPTNLASGGLFTPLIIALGAAQAAIVLATPIPEYAKGKKASDSYEGMAIAGEKGTEMKIDKDGSIQLLTKPTLIHTKRGDTILSNEQLKRGAAENYLAEKVSYDELIRAYSYNTDKLVKAVKNSGNNIIIDNSNYNLNIQKARA